MAEITFGTDCENDEPVSFPVAMLLEMMLLICGAPGSMKTVLMTSIMAQWLRLRNHVVGIVDLGGDLAAFNVLKAVAESVGKKVYLVALDETVDCYGWNMLSTEVFRIDPKRAVPGIQGSLRLSLPDGYPTTFWSRMAAAEIQDAIDGMKAVDKWTFEEFTKQLGEMEAESKSKHPSSAYAAAKELAPYFKVLSLREKQLNLAQAIDESALIYFYLPVGPDGGAAKSLAAAALYCFMLEAGLRVDSGCEKRIIHLGVDEYAQIAQPGGVTEAMCNLCRKHHVNLCLLLQSLALVDANLQSTLRTNCSQFLFDAWTSEEQQAIQSVCYDVYGEDSRTQSNPGGLKFGSQSTTEKKEPSLSKNDLLDMSGVRSECLAFLKLGDQFREPFRMRVQPAVSKEVHDKLKARPLPRLKEPLLSLNEETNTFDATPDPELLKLMDRMHQTFGA